jgi:hypothetical protein
MALIVTIPAVSSTVANCLRSNNPTGGDGQTAYVGNFWPIDTDLKSYFLEYYVKLIGDGWPGTAYFFSSGQGGAHAILAGVNLSSGTYLLQGNVRRYNTGTTALDNISFTSAAPFGVAIGEWAKIDYSFDANTCTLYAHLNGICVCVQSFGTPGTHVRRIQTSDFAQDMYIAGGSTHSQLSAYFAQMRLFDGHATGGQVYSAGQPEMPYVFDRQLGPTVLFAPSIKCDLGFDFTTGGGLVVTDFAPDGRQADHLRHHAIITNSLANGFGGAPVWDLDPSVPCTASAIIPATGEKVRTPTTPPSGAIVYDSFERTNSTYLNGRSGSHLQLGSVEVGLVGQKTWSYGVHPGQSNGNPLVFGILCGYAVSLANCQRTFAVVETGVANQQVIVSAFNSSTIHKRCGLIARFSDANNFIFVYQANDVANALYFGKVAAGVEVYYNAGTPVSCNPSTTWTSLTLNCNGNTLTLQTDGNTIFTTTDSFNNTATKAGLNKYDYPAPTVSSTWRAKDFTVKAAF